ncbi:MAG TPA: porin [Rhizomicrobium sp.]|jgi:phosphate-selective porin OprO/OprP|nr:porin [Rhizomicrobium sp.]
MKMRTLLLGGAALLVSAVPALADDAAILKRLDDMQRMMELQQKQIAAQRGEISALRGALRHKGVVVPAAPAMTAEAAPSAPPAPIEARVAQQQVAIDDLVNKFAAAEDHARIEKADQPVWSLAGGRPSVTSSDGRFSFAVRSIVQYDNAYFSQSAAARQLGAANGPDLSSGSNFRRAQLGVSGKVFGDWNYYFNYDFGSGASSGNELQGRIQQAYVEYAGLAPFAVRVGAFPPSANLEDATGAGDVIFFERNAPSDLQRSLGGADGRDAIALIYAGDETFASVAYTGGSVAATTLFFDEQQAIVARASDLVYSDSDWKLLASAAATYVLHGGDATAGAGSARNITLADGPELTTDDNLATERFVSTGAINAARAWNYGLEGAAEWRNLYAQAGYFGYGVDQLAAAAPELNFDGWYAQATWIITGESRPYNVANGSFANPKPRIPFSLDGWGPGAWELAARYSDLDLNDHAGVLGAALPAGGIRGGDQRIFTAALNWYPNSVLKFSLQYQDIQVSRIGTIPAGFGHGVLNNSEVGQNLGTFAFRSQIAL